MLPDLPINPHWREFFRRIRKEAERLDELEKQRESQAAQGGSR